MISHICTQFSCVSVSGVSGTSRAVLQGLGHKACPGNFEAWCDFPLDIAGRAAPAALRPAAMTPSAMR